MIQRRRSQPPNDEVRSDGDTGFIGVNMKLAPDKLPPGYCALAINKTFRTGLAETRGGVVLPVHFNPSLALSTLGDVDHLVISISNSPLNTDFAHFASLTWATPDITAAPLSANAALACSIRSLGDDGYYIETSGIDPLLTMVAPQVPDAAHIHESEIYINLRAVRAALGSGEDIEWVLRLGYTPVGVNGTLADPRYTVRVTAYSGGTATRTGTTYSLSGATEGAHRDYIFEVTDTSNATAVLTLSSVASDNVRISEATIPALLVAGTYTDDDAREWTLLAGKDHVWKVRAGTTPTTFDLPFMIEQAGDFTAFSGQVLLWRGTESRPLVWDGESEWEEYEPTDLTASTLGLPNADTAEVIGNRMAIIAHRDTVILTDVLALRYDPVNAAFRINQGSDDTLVRVLPFTATSLLCFKSRGVYLLENLYGDLGDARLTDVNREIGLAARRAVAQVGADVFFLSRTGVYRLAQVVESRIATAPVPVSDPIEPFFRTRVNWAAIDGATAGVVGEYFYLALPIDGATRNNALLLYNLTSQAWEGWHTFGAGVRGLEQVLALEYRGQRRLFTLDAANGLLFLHGEGQQDVCRTATYEIADELLTRGYALEGAGFKTFTGAEVTLQTSRPSFTVKLESDGVNETSTLCTSRTKSRTISYLFGQAPYSLTNVNNDHAREGRQDYGVLCSDSATPRAAGLLPDLQQQAAERFPVRRRGRYAQLRITSAQGRCDLVQARIEGRHHEPLTRTTAA